MNKVVRERFKGLRRELKLKDIALKLQSKEYKRRLKGLNHEASRIKEAQSRSVSGEKFEGEVKQIQQMFENIKKDIKELSDKNKTLEGKNAWTQRYLPWGLTIILSIIALVLAYYK